MGRLKSWQNLNPLFAGRYKKLLEEYGNKDYCRLLLQENLQEGLSYSCRECGHSQTLEAEELNSIVGHAFRLAYAAHLQKSASSACLKDTTSSCGSSHTLSPAHRNIHTHIDQRPCDITCLQRNSISQTDVNQSVTSHCSPEIVMRAPGTTGAIHPHTSTDVGGTTKPSTLPGLIHHHNNNLLHSPDSEISNSPTELNSTRRLTDKPPLVKKLTVGEISGPLVTCCSTESSQALSVTTAGSTGSSTSTAVVGYVNDQSSSSTLPVIPQIHTSTISKCVTPEGCIDVVDCPLTGSSVTAPPPLPERSDSLTPPEEPHLKGAAWFQAGIPREIALEVLSREPVGAFMVRESTSKPGCYALSLRVPRDFTMSGIAHYLIVKSSKGYKIKGFTKDFPTLTALITHHSVMPELLPCPLSLSRYNPSFTNDDQTKTSSSTDDDPDYNTLSDFRKMMADLDV